MHFVCHCFPIIIIIEIKIIDARQQLMEQKILDSKAVQSFVRDEKTDACGWKAEIEPGQDAVTGVSHSSSLNMVISDLRINIRITECMCIDELGYF